MEPVSRGIPPAREPVEEEETLESLPLGKRYPEKDGSDHEVPCDDDADEEDRPPRIPPMDEPVAEGCGWLWRAADADPIPTT